MRVLVIAHYQNDTSPTAVFVHEQVKAIAKKGYETLVLVPIAIGKQDYHNKRNSRCFHSEIIDGIEHCFIRYLSISSFGTKSFNTNRAICSIKKHAMKRIGEFKPDIIHAHTLGFDSEIGAWIKELCKIPLVVTTHGSDAMIPIIAGNKRALVEWCNKADYLVCVGEKIKKELTSCGVTTEIQTIHNGFNIENLVENPKKKKFTIVQVGNLVPSKNYKTTIEVFAHLKHIYPEFRLFIVGKGTEEVNLKKIIKEKSIENAVTFYGQLPNKEVMRILSESEYFVMNSYPEGFGIAYIEAMASGCITIGTKDEGISDVIKDGINGFLVPKNGTEEIERDIILCIKSPTVAKSIVESGMRTAKQLTWDKNAEMNILIYKALVEKVHKNETAIVI